MRRALFSLLFLGCASSPTPPPRVVADCPEPSAEVTVTARRPPPPSLDGRWMLSEIDDASLIGADVVATCSPETTECLLGLARDSGDDQALFIVAQKTSTLILQLFANLVDTESGDLILSRNLNFRGDNDDAWRRAGRFLARQMREAGE